jgi:hypothetical protein
VTAWRGQAAALALGVTFAAGRGASAADRVTVVRAIDAGPPVTEVATRAWAELNAGGVEARLVACASDAVDCPAEAAGRRELTLAVISVWQAGETVTRVDVSVPGRGIASSRRTVSFAERAAEAKVIAIRAVELVHAALLDDAEETAAPAAPAAPAAEDVEVPGVRARPPPPPPGPFRASAALGTLRSLGGLTPGYGVVLRGERTGKRGFGVSILATSPMIGASNPSDVYGSVATYQEMIAVQGIQRFRQDARVQPYLSAGAGLYLISLRFGAAPDVVPRGRDETLASALLLAGAGFDVPLGRQLLLTADAQLAFASPHPGIRLSSGQTGTAANPSLLVSVGLQRSF